MWVFIRLSRDLHLIFVPIWVSRWYLIFHYGMNLSSSWHSFYANSSIFFLKFMHFLKCFLLINAKAVCQKGLFPHKLFVFFSAKLALFTLNFVWNTSFFTRIQNDYLDKNLFLTKWLTRTSWISNVYIPYKFIILINRQSLIRDSIFFKWNIHAMWVC